MLQTWQLSLGYHSVSVGSTFYTWYQRETYSFSSSLRNAAGWICPEIWNGSINPRNDGLEKRVSVRWSVLTTGIHRYWQFLKYTNQMLSTWYYLYLFCYLAVHKLALSSLTAISPQCPQASLCLEKRTSNTIISNNFSNHVRLLNHTSLESITKWLWLRCSEFFQ